MALEAPLSKHKKNTLLIYAVVCLGMAGYFYYDGYYNTSFIEKHTVDGVPDGTLVFNQKWGPLALVPLGIGFLAYLFLIKDKKVVLEENKLVVSRKVIDCDAIEKIDKTFFDSKGYFFVTYKDSAGAEKTVKLSESNYDDLEAVLEHLVAKIS